MLDSVIENRIINNLASRFCRSPLQQNLLHESDSEIIRLGHDHSVALTIDSISEEIQSGLYDPYLAGWMVVMANFSDIAASGADPLGILISEILPDAFSSVMINQIQSGINDAVQRCGSFVLGGDTNTGENLILTGCAFGKFSGNKYLKRTGCSEGDILFVSYPPGRGNAYAASRLLKDDRNMITYRPTARLKEAVVIREFAGCCIDTSDGVLTALDQLMRLNNLGFRLNDNWLEQLDAEAAEAVKKMNIPLWMLYAGQHGEFELLFTIPSEKEAAFITEAKKTGWNPLRIGVAAREQEIRVKLYNKSRVIDTRKLRDLPFITGGNIKTYLDKLLQYDQTLKVQERIAEM